MKKTKSILLIIVIVFVLFIIAKDVIAQAVIEKGVTQLTGLSLSMKQFNLKLLGSSINIEGLKLENPSNFEERTMVDLPKIYAKIDIPALIKGKVHLEMITLHLAEFSVIKNKSGQLNLDALTALGGDGNKPKKAKAEKAPAKPVDLQIDVLDLKIEKVQYLDHSLLGKATSQSFDARIDERFENITDPKVLVRTIISKALKNTSIGRLANFDIGQFGDIASSSLAHGKQFASDSLGHASKALDQVKDVNMDKIKDMSVEKLGQSTDSASRAISGAASSLKDSAGDLFGGFKAKVQESTT